MKILVLFLLFSIALSNTCGGNCPKNDCPSCPCGSTKNILTNAQIASQCSNYSWNQTCCQCISNYASLGNSNAVRYISSTSTYNVGLFLINRVIINIFR